MIVASYSPIVEGYFSLQTFGLCLCGKQRTLGGERYEWQTSPTCGRYMGASWRTCSHRDGSQLTTYVDGEAEDLARCFEE